MNKKLRITLVILMAVFIFEPLKHLGLRPLTNLERPFYRVRRLFVLSNYDA